MIKKKFVIINDKGIHSRAWLKLFAPLGAYRDDCEIVIEKDDVKVDAFHIVDVLMLSIVKGQEITVYVNGHNEDDVMEQISSIIERGFDE